LANARPILRRGLRRGMAIPDDDRLHDGRVAFVGRGNFVVGRSNGVGGESALALASMARDRSASMPFTSSLAIHTRSIRG
jgi:hypothetical protein